MLNLEIKVVASNLKEVKNKVLEIKALDKGVLNQIDTYFIIGNKRLKLREEKDANYLVLYLRKNIKESRVSKYYILNIPKYLLSIIKILLTIIFGVKIIINKKRELFIYKNTRIHLDSVDNLGRYIELETVFKKNSKEGDLKKEHNLLLETLGLDKLEKISKSYSDMVIENSKN